MREILENVEQLRKLYEERDSFRRDTMSWGKYNSKIDTKTEFIRSLILEKELKEERNGI